MWLYSTYLIFVLSLLFFANIIPQVGSQSFETYKKYKIRNSTQHRNKQSRHALSDNKKSNKNINSQSSKIKYQNAASSSSLPVVRKDVIIEIRKPKFIQLYDAILEELFPEQIHKQSFGPRRFDLKNFELSPELLSKYSTFKNLLLKKLKQENLMFISKIPGKNGVYHFSRQVPFHPESSNTSEDNLSQPTSNLSTTRRRRRSASSILSSKNSNKSFFNSQPLSKKLLQSLVTIKNSNQVLLQNNHYKIEEFSIKNRNFRNNYLNSKHLFDQHMLDASRELSVPSKFNTNTYLIDSIDNTRTSSASAHTIQKRDNNGIIFEMSANPVMRPNEEFAILLKNYKQPNDPNWPDMWYMHRPNYKSGTHHMNVTAAWVMGYTGKGVTVTILDDGIERDHPDLIGNYDSMASTDINGNDDDPIGFGVF